jgi:serine protease
MSWLWAAPLVVITLVAASPTDLPLRVIRRSPAHDSLAYRSGQVLVKFDQSATYAAAMRAISHSGGLAARPRLYGGHLLVTLDRGVSVPEAVARLRTAAGVLWAEPNGLLHSSDLHAQAATTFTPDDQLFSHQWHMKLLNAERTWGIQQGKPSVVVAVVDTGIAYEDYGVFRRAPDWSTTVFVPGFNALTGDTHANDDNFHGTHVASTIAEATNNGTGVAGLAFGCALMPVKVLDANGEGDFDTVAQGISFAAHATPRADVINLSLGGGGDSDAVNAAIDDAVNAGIVVVAAAGNDGQRGVSYPARRANVISVGAVDARKVLAPYSNFGPELDVVAPGGDIDRDDDNDGRPDGVLQQTFDPDVAANEHRYDDFAYFFVDGTSQATPHVSALAALLISQGIKPSNAAGVALVRAMIENTAEDLGAPGRDDTYGHGLIQPAIALKGLGLGLAP